MNGAIAILTQTDDILRQRFGSLGPAGSISRRWRLASQLVAAGIIYGTVMGAFGGVSGDRAWMTLYSAVKVPLLLVATFAISLPSFFVVNTLLGLRRDWTRAVESIVAAQAVMAIALASLAPLTIVWYCSSNVYEYAVLFNAAMFAAASMAGHIALSRLYRPLIVANPLHRWVLRTWIGVYAFVGIQMGWMLRPFIGGPTTPVQFFRTDAQSLGNAYEAVWKLIASALGL